MAKKGIHHRDYLVVDDRLYRPSEVNDLQGDATKAYEKLKWTPTVSFEELIKEMVEGDLKWHRKGAYS